MIDIYLAAPFFTPEQLNLVTHIENEFSSSTTIRLFSPRKHGIMFSTIPKEEHSMAAYKIMRINIGAIQASDLVLAVTDGSDQGTMIEIGMAFAWKIPIITYTKENKGVNLMLREISKAHIIGHEELCKLRLIVSINGWNEMLVKKNFSDKMEIEEGDKKP